MKREDLLKEMREAVGTKDPILFFEKMVDLFADMSSQLNRLEVDLHRLKKQTALSIQWDSKIASDMLAEQVQILRADKDTYSNEIHQLKQAFTEDKVTQNYNDFCQFWLTCLGWHPFLDYNK